MEKLNFSYSLKNIPTPHEDSYKKRLLEKIDIFIKKLRWRASYLFYKQQQKATEDDKQGFS